MTGQPLSPCRIAIALALLSITLTGCAKLQQASAAPADEQAPSYVAVARGQSTVEGGLLQLSAPREGTLASIAVHEGDHVQRGQTLAILDPTSAQLAVQAAEAELHQAQAEAQLYAGKLAMARTQAQRLEAAAKAGAGDGQSADQARGTANELAAQQTAADAAVGVAQQKLDSARYELNLRTVRAPIDAQVTRVNVQPGATVSPQSGPLFQLLPNTQPIVVAELSESMVDAVKVGMPAIVSTDGGGSDRSWPAHVLRIGRVLGPSQLEDDPQQQLNRTVRCVLAFDQRQDLRIGERLLVRFGTQAASAGRKPAETH